MFERPPRSHLTGLIFKAVSVLLVAGGVLAFVVPLAIRTMTLADEGYILLQSLDMLKGRVLYRDMDAFVTPGVWFLNAATFELFGASVLTSRIPVVIAYLALIGVSYRITRVFAGVAWGIAGILVMMTCTVWAFPAWTFSFYSPYAVLFALAGLERLLAWRGSALRRDLVLCGACFGLSIAFKQNYGVFGLVGAVIGLVALHLEDRESARESIRGVVRDGLVMAGGVAAVGLPFVVWFVYHGAFAEAFHSLVIQPFEFSGKHDIAYLDLGAIFRSDLMSDIVELMTYGAQPMYRATSPGGWVDSVLLLERLHVPLYWFPPIVFILGTTLVLLPKHSSRGAGGGDEGSDERDLERDAEHDEARPIPIDGKLAAVLAVSFFVFLGVFPRADFNHLINVYQPVVVSGVVFFAVLFREHLRPRSIAFFGVAGVVSAILALYVGVAAYWYQSLLENLDTEFERERGGVKITALEDVALRFVLDQIDTFSAPGRAVLTIPDLSMINFLSGRPMPSPYYNLYEHHIAHDQGAAVVAGAEAHGVDVALANYNDFFSDRRGLRDYAPKLVEYLQTHFIHSYTIGRDDFILLRRRDVPVEPEKAVSLLEQCWLSEPNSYVKKHLLFPILYHSTGIGGTRAEATVTTRCRATIPEAGGELVVRIGYHHPLEVITETSLMVEVLVKGEQANSRVFREYLTVTAKSPKVYRFPVPPEFRIDLSAFAGRTIDLLLRTTRTGQVIALPVKGRPFGAAWQDPRIVEIPSGDAASTRDGLGAGG